MDHEDRLEALDNHLHETTNGLDQMRDSVAQLDERLRQLTEAHEAIELQLALLSKEAEHHDSWLRLSDPDSEFASRQRPDSDKLHAIEQKVLALANSVERLGVQRSATTGAQDTPGRWANIESDLTEDRRRIDLLLTRIDALEAEIADVQRTGADFEAQPFREGSAGASDTEPAAHGAEASAPGGHGETGSSPADVVQTPGANVGHHPNRVHHDIQALKVAGGKLLDRLVALERQGRSLKSTLSSIGVEQARRDNEARQVGQQLRRRSLVSVLALLLASVSVFLVLQQAPFGAADRTLPVAEPMSAPTAVPASDADIDAAVAELREEMMLFDSSLAALTESVDQLALAPQKARDGLISDVRQSLAQLADEDAQLREEVAEIKRELGRIDDAVARIIAPRSNVPAVSVATHPLVLGDMKKPPEGSSVEPAPVERDIDEGKPVVRVVAVPVIDSVENDWEAARSARQYTLQLMGVSRPGLLDAVLQQYGLEGPNAVHRGTREGRDWFALLHGIYASSDEAKAAVAQLPAALSNRRPWVRQVPSTGTLEPR